MASGIDWSAPVRVEAADGGRIRVELPDKAARVLGVQAGDVLCFTGFANGTVEIWPVKKSPYSSLDDEGAADQAIERATQRRDETP